MALRVQCPAKVNLFLEVTGKRPDGYHRLATLFAKINLYDVLELESAPGRGLKFTVEPEGAAPEGPENLVCRAARSFSAAFNEDLGVNIRLTKRIPVGAGLGGGSSDAAGALLGLTKLYELPLSAARNKTLRRIARGLGADVPFFMQPSPFCIGEGIGDRLRPVRLRQSLPYMILAYPGFGIATAEAYRSLARPPRPVVLTRLSQLDKLTRSLGEGRPLSAWEGLLFNRLEEAAVPALSRVAQVRDILGRVGLRGVRMTGSGSSVFGFVPSFVEGERILKLLRRYPWQVFLTSCNG